MQIETPDEFLWPDMSARITFFDEAETPSGTTTAILVPQSAIRSDDAGTFVWVVRDARAQRVGIATGKDFGEQVQVTSGLTGDETVVVGTPPPLKDGQAVATKS